MTYTEHLTQFLVIKGAIHIVVTEWGKNDKISMCFCFIIYSMGMNHNEYKFAFTYDDLLLHLALM